MSEGQQKILSKKKKSFYSNFRRFTQIFRHFNANFLHFVRVFLRSFFEAENTLVLIPMFLHVSAAIVFSCKYSKKITSNSLKLQDW